MPHWELQTQAVVRDLRPMALGLATDVTMIAQVAVDLAAEVAKGRAWSGRQALTS